MAFTHFVGPLTWLTVVIAEGVTCKMQGTRLMHLVSTRGLPAPKRNELEAGILEHGRVLTLPIPPTHPDRLKIISRLSRRIAHNVANRIRDGYRSVAHVSLTNSASLAGPRRTGGRAVDVGTSFARRAASVSEVDQTGETLFGAPYRLKSGLPWFRTMCREDDLPESKFIESDNTFDIDCLSIDTFKVEDRIYGLDHATGYQLLQWSIEEGIRSGSLSGVPYKTPDPELQLKVVSPPAVRAVPIGEPGFKTRVITVSEGWVSQLLSPFGHELTSLLSYLPQARPGLTAAAQAYEYVKRISHKRGIDSVPELFWLTSDLTMASDYIRHDIAEAALKAFFKGLGFLDPYIKLSIELLASPRTLEPASGTSFYEYTGSTTTQGVLMGDPGTKGALTLFMLLAEEEAYLRYCYQESFLDPQNALKPSETWRCFASAGDDHLAVGPLEYLEAITHTLTLNGACVSVEKSFKSKIGAYFSEEMLLRTPDTVLESKEPPWERKYNLTIHVDALKTRLLSPCSKVTLVRDEKNPVFGKGRYFYRKLAWLPSPADKLAPVFDSRFKFRFKSYVDAWDNPMLYLPTKWGGLGFLYPPDNLGERLLDLPNLVLKALKQVRDGEADHYVVSALRAYAANTTFRGIDSRTLALEELKGTMELFSDNVTEEFIRDKAGIPIEKWGFMRVRDKIRTAKKIGYTLFEEVPKLLERPTYFKQVLTRQHDLIENLPEVKLLREIEAEVDSQAELEDLTIAELFEVCPYYEGALEAARRAAYAKQMRIETFSFQGIPGQEGDELRQEYPAELKTAPHVERGGFNTRSLPRRLSVLVGTLRRYMKSSQLSSDDIMSITETLAKPGDIQVEPEPLRFVHNRRLASMCTLSTPLAWRGPAKRTS